LRVAVTVSIFLPIFAALAIPLLGRLFRAARQTTLFAPWCWAVAACAAIVLVESMALIVPDGNLLAHTLPPARVVVALVALCPTISVLGAKRPQHRAWQFVVFAFLLVLLIPVARNVLLHPGLPIKLHAAQTAFLHVVALMGVVNWAATRYGAAAIIAGAAQCMLIQPPTWTAQTASFDALLAAPLHPLVAGALATCALLVVALTPRRPTSASRAWLDFRDQLGLFWAARVLSRFNAAAAEKRWPVRLAWRGIEPFAHTAPPAGSPQRKRGEPPLDPAYVAIVSDAVARRTLRMLLLRFVSAPWLAARPDAG
jgi:hypothetical protein